MAISPDLFVPSGVFKQQVNDLISEIKASKKRPGVLEIYYPGEKSQKKRNENRSSEYIDMVDQVVENVRKFAEA